ncbi:MAG TPA: RsmE family RNA methyltransferase [Turneriella sp.]|nr:RsmE family RNA methyltransferase [Turneriella sp.]
MQAHATPLRTLQKKHHLILLSHEEFSFFSEKKMLKLPMRHVEHFHRILRRSTPWSALVSDGGCALVHAQVKDNYLHATDTPIIPILSPPYTVDLVQAWVKPKTLSVILQKAAELGVRRIYFTPSDHSQREQYNEKRCDAILENACMQSYNPLKPTVHILKDLHAIIFPAQDAAFFGDLSATQFFTTIQQEKRTSTLFINGPEGGFSPSEIIFLRTKATGVLLSENVLRSESAAIIALGYLKAR